MSTEPHHTISSIHHADAAYEDVRGLNHATIWRRVIPAPEVYAIVGSLRQAGYGLAQACDQLAGGLIGSLTALVVYEDDGRDPATSVALAEEHLRAAAGLAKQFGAQLDAAQSAIAGQGYISNPDCDEACTPGSCEHAAAQNRATKHRHRP